MKSLPVARLNELLLPFFLFISTASFAQGFGPLGAFTTEDVKMTECSFDKEAPAVVLIHEARSDYSMEHHLVTTHHFKIKILKEKGIEFANIEIPFYRDEDFEYIDEIHAVTINVLPNGDFDKHELERSSIYTEKTGPYWGTMKFAFPAVKVGSILDYTYRSTMKHYGGLAMEPFNLQERIPVVKCKYNVAVVPEWEFAYQVEKSPKLQIDIKENKDLGSISFEMDNVPGLNTEPYMDSRADYLQKVRFQLSGYTGWGYKQKFNTSWGELARYEMHSEFLGTQLDKDLQGSEEFINQTKQLPSDFLKMYSVYDYVRKQMTWNGVHLNFSPDGIKAAWTKKIGSSGDINLILVHLLRAVGVSADPMLVSERSHGRVNELYPFREQFNSIYATVNANNRIYFLDASKKFLSPTITPYEILNTTAFVLNKPDGNLLPIIGGDGIYNQQIVTSGAVTNEGMLTGSVRVKSAGYARPPRVETYLSNKEKFTDEYFKKDMDGMVIEDLAVQNENVDTLPFIQNAIFHLPLTTSGDYQIVDLNLFTAQHKNPFISENRFSNINFGYRQRILLTTMIDVPSSFTVDGLPSAANFSTADGSINFQKTVSFNDGKLVQNCLLEVSKPMFLANEYSIVKDFYKRMYDSLKEPLVLKKK